MSSPLGQRLSEEHRELERQFDDVCERAREGDWQDLDEVWDDFTSNCCAHFDFEERVIFPELARVDEPSRSFCQQRQHEHTAMRRALDEFGLQIQLHHVRASAIEEFVAMMRKHAEIENQRMYPRVDRAAS